MSGERIPQRNYGTAYALWLFCLLSVCGIHRIYAGRYLSGVLYIFTFGLFGLGQFLDLFFIPNMIDEENLKTKALYGYQPNQASFYRTPQSLVINLPQESPPEAQPELNAKQPLKQKDLDRAILKTCKDNQGATLAELFLEIDEEYERLQERVEDLMHKGLLTVDNRVEDGAVIYKMT